MALSCSLCAGNARICAGPGLGFKQQAGTVAAVQVGRDVAARWAIGHHVVAWVPLWSFACLCDRPCTFIWEAAHPRRVECWLHIKTLWPRLAYSALIYGRMYGRISGRGPQHHGQTPGVGRQRLVLPWRGAHRASSTARRRRLCLPTHRQACPTRCLALLSVTPSAMCACLPAMA